jgi:hypothetical protein
MNRAERREEIKLILEYVKVATSFGFIGTLLFAGLQWKQANEAADRANQTAIAANKAAVQVVYQRIANEWRDHLQTFVKSPDLRPYFEGKRELSANDANREAVLAVADIRLDVMDAILTYASLQGYEKEIKGWRNTFAGAFSSSPALCSRMHGTEANYGLIVPIARQACPGLSTSPQPH